jgi:hypothetical protein
MRALIEQQVFKALQGLVQPLHGGEVPSTTTSSSPHSKNPTPWPARSADPSQRATTPSMSNLGSLRTVMSALGVANAASSLVVSLPVAGSRLTAYAVRK